MEGRFLTLLPACGAVLKKCFEMRRQSRCAIGITQFINDHRRGVRFAQKRLRDTGVTIDAHRVNRADAAARYSRNIETAILTAGGEQLHAFASRNIQCVGQTRSDNHGVRSITKIIQTAFHKLMREIGCLEMKRRVDPEKIDRCIFKTGASA